MPAKTPTHEAWRSRILRHEKRTPSELLPNPKNPRTHPKSQTEIIDASLVEIGWMAEVVFNEQSGHLIDGHARVKLALEYGEASVPVTVVDLDPAEESLALATLNPLSALAETNAETLDLVLRDIDTGDTVLQSFLAGLAEDHAWDDSPAEVDPAGQEKTSRISRRDEVIRLVLYPVQVAVVEQAIRESGRMNRGEALTAICEAYLEKKEG